MAKKKSKQETPVTDLDELDLLSQSIESKLDTLTVPAKQHLPKPRPLKRKRPIKKTAYHHGDLRQSLIDAAFQMIIQKGSESLSLRSLAKAVGVSPAAPYRHFQDKQELIAAVATQGFEILASQMAELPPSSALERLNHIATRYLQFALNYPDYFRLMYGPEIREKNSYTFLQEASNKTMLHLLEGIRQAKEAGLLKAIPPEQVALSLWSQIHGFAALLVEEQFDWKSLDKDGPESLLLSNLELLFQGLMNP